MSVKTELEIAIKPQSSNGDLVSKLRKTAAERRKGRTMIEEVIDPLKTLVTVACSNQECVIEGQAYEAPDLNHYCLKMK